LKFFATTWLFDRPWKETFYRILPLPLNHLMAQLGHVEALHLIPTESQGAGGGGTRSGFRQLQFTPCRQT
jgi:hypothetical protein